MLFGSDVMIALQQAQDGDDIDLGMAAYLEDPKSHWDYVPFIH